MHSKLLGFLFVSVLAAAAPRAHAERVFAVTGVVRAPLSDSRIVVAHEEIVGYMPAMTMAFEVPPEATPSAIGLAVGDRVRFALHVDAERAFAAEFRVVGRGGSPTPPAEAAAAVRRLQVGDELPPFRFTDERDQPLTSADLAGHVTVVTFLFTRCPVPEFCPLMARRFAGLQKEILADPSLRDRARLVGITLDPEYDRPAVLKAYGEAVGATAPQWRFATGAPSDVRSLVTAFSVYVERNGVQLNHTLCTALVGPTGRILQIWRGNGWSVDEVLAAVREAAR